MSIFYTADCQVFSGNGVISISLTPQDSENSTSYSIECPIEKEFVEKLLIRLGFGDLLGVQEQPEQHCVDQECISSLIDDFSTQGTDLSGDIGDMEVVIMEKIQVKKPLIVNDTIYEKGSVLKFFYKGEV
jgi:hypothetical protein